MKKVKYLILSLFVFFIANSDVSAGSLSIWASSSNVKVGSTVTISINAKSLFGTFNIKSSDSSILSGPTSGDLDDNTGTYTFTAKKTGTITITVTPVDMADYDTEQYYTTSKSVTLKVLSNPSSGESPSSGGTTSEKKNYSSDNTLSSLEIEGHQMNPKFDKETTEYSLSLDQSVEKIKINAKANDSKATVSGTGEVNLSDGENNLEVKVTAENGNEKIYKIKVIVEDKNPIIVTIDNKKYTIMKKNNKVMDKLEGYEEGTIKIENQDVICYTNKNNHLTLVLLKNEDGNLGYYIYDNGKYSFYNENTFQTFKLFLLDMPLDRIPNGYSKFDFTYNEKKYIGYKLNKDSDFYLIYAMNLENGEKELYIYDSKMKTASRYDNGIEKYYSNKMKTEIKKYQTAVVGIVGIVVLVMIVKILISLTKGNKGRVKRKIK